MKFTNRLDAILAENAQAFANSFGLPRISPWIVQQYNKGHQSHKDYEAIVKWVTNNNPNIDGYDFNNALKQARAYCDSIRQTDGFNPYSELQSKDVVIDFDNGKKWISIGADDCNAICHRLKYDCSQELQPVLAGEYNCYALQDAQDNTIGIYIDSEPYQLIGQFGKPITGNHEEIKGLCVRKGINPIPEAYSDIGLAKALATKEIDIESLPDISSAIRRLSALDIINCGLLNYAHHAKIKTIYDLYSKTGHDCLLQYAMCYLIVNNHTSSPAYQKIKAAVKSNPVVSQIISSSRDTRHYSDLLDQATSEISSL